MSHPCVSLEGGGGSVDKWHQQFINNEQDIHDDKNTHIYTANVVVAPTATSHTRWHRGAGSEWVRGAVIYPLEFLLSSRGIQAERASGTSCLSASSVALSGTLCTYNMRTSNFSVTHNQVFTKTRASSTYPALGFFHVTMRAFRIFRQTDVYVVVVFWVF